MAHVAKEALSSLDFEKSPQAIVEFVDCQMIFGTAKLLEAAGSDLGTLN